MNHLEHKIKTLEHKVETLEKRIHPLKPEFNDNLEQRATILILCLIAGLAIFYVAYNAI